MRKPDFFIVGAPKCGTTSLCSYLDQHPEIYISKPKEPYFFCPDLKSTNMTSELYSELFQKSHKKISGEGSTWYLYSEVAAKSIKEFNPSAKIIIMLREPISLLHSLHNQKLYSLTEDEKDFERALNFDGKRDVNHLISRTSNTHKMYSYIDIVIFSKQIKRYHKYFERDHIKIILFEDFKDHTLKVYQDVLTFLEVEPTFEPNLKIHNENVNISNLHFHRILHKPPRSLFRLSHMITPPFLSPLRRRIGWGLISMAKGIFNQKGSRAPVNKKTITYLKSSLSEEIDDLSRLIETDLNHWK